METIAGMGCERTMRERSRVFRNRYLFSSNPFLIKAIKSQKREKLKE